MLYLSPPCLVDVYSACCPDDCIDYVEFLACCLGDYIDYVEFLAGSCLVVSYFLCSSV